MRIIPTTEAYVSGFHAALGTVARERQYLGFIESPPLERTIDFVRALLADGGLQMLAVTDTNEVVGWCDIARHRWEGLRHVGRLGMGLLAPYRGQGLGRQLAMTTIEAAFRHDIERIELDVFSSNVAAIRLYETLGFQREGVRRRFRKLDGVYDGNIIMALLSPSAA